MKKIIFLIVVLQTAITISLFSQNDKLTIEKLESGTIVYSLKRYKTFKEEKRAEKNYYGSSKYDNVTEKYKRELASFVNDKINSIGWPFEGEKFIAGIYDNDNIYSFFVSLNNKGKVVAVSIFAPASSKLKNTEKLKDLLKAIGTWNKPYYSKLNAPNNTYVNWGL